MRIDRLPDAHDPLERTAECELWVEWFMPRTNAEINFIDQHTRKLLVGWADHMVAFPEGSVPLDGVTSAYVEHALAKGWLTKRAPHRLTAKGFQVAASFLKR